MAFHRPWLADGSVNTALADAKARGDPGRHRAPARRSPPRHTSPPRRRSGPAPHRPCPHRHARSWAASRRRRSGLRPTSADPCSTKGDVRRPKAPLSDVIDWVYTGNRLHPTQKSVEILTPLITGFCPAGAWCSTLSAGPVRPWPLPRASAEPFSAWSSTTSTTAPPAGGSAASRTDGRLEAPFLLEQKTNKN